MKISEKNGIVKWEDDIQEDWYMVRGNWFHVVKSKDGIYVNGKLFPEPTPYNQRLKEMGWDFHEELLFVMEQQADEKIPMTFETKKLVPRKRKLREDYIQHTDENGDTWICPAKNVNLLPKESTMRTRYAVVNLREKVEFEKKWEMSYGYNNCPYIGFTQKDAMEWVKRNLGPTEKKDYIVERHNAGKVDIVWKIDSLIVQEEDEHDEEF